jgi:hypothetical protein
MLPFHKNDGKRVKNGKGIKALKIMHNGKASRPYLFFCGMCIPTAIHPAHERHGNKFEKGNEK